MTSSSFDQSESEIIKIKSIINEKTIQVEPAIKHKHYGTSSTPVINDQEINTRSEIALLSRNIKLTGTQSDDGYGLHIYINQIENVTESNIQIDGIQVTNGGHYRTQRYTLNIRHLKDSFIKRSSFNLNNNIGIYIRNSLNFQFESI